MRSDKTKIMTAVEMEYCRYPAASAKNLQQGNLEQNKDTKQRAVIYLHEKRQKLLGHVRRDEGKAEKLVKG